MNAEKNGPKSDPKENPDFMKAVKCLLETPPKHKTTKKPDKGNKPKAKKEAPDR